MKFRIFLASLVLAVLVPSSMLRAQSSASGMFTVQGRLTNTNGVPVADGSHRITSNIYVKGNATAVYSQSDTLNTSDGIFTVLLGASKKLTLDSKSSYEVGVSLDGAAELQPHIPMGYAPRAMTALMADSTLVATSLSAAGIANLASTLGSNVVTSVNGERGAVTILGGGALGVSTQNDTVHLNFTGTGSGLLLPFLDTLPLPFLSKFTIVNPSSGLAGTFQNKGTGTALRVQAVTGSAITAQSSGGNATIDVVNTGGAAINALSTSGNAIAATTNAGDVAALYLKNTGTGSGRLIRGDNNAGYPILDVTNLGTTISGSDTAAAGATLRVQQRSRLGSNVLVVADSSNNSLLTVSRLGATAVNSSAATALNVTASNGMGIMTTAHNATGTALDVKNSALPNSNAYVIMAHDSGGAALLKVSTTGTTSLLSATSMALSAVASNGSGAAAQIQNTASAASTALTVKDSAGNAILNVAGNGTSIASYGAGAATTSLAVTPAGAVLRSNAATSFYDSTTVGNTAARLVGGLSVVGPVGTGTILTGNGSVTINNPYAKTNSIIFVTVASNATSIVPVRVASTGSGSFVVALIGVGSLANDLSFNYLIINQ